MTERPILFSGAMVRAILAGRKTVTRRVMKNQPSESPVVGTFQVGKGTRYSRNLPFKVVATWGDECCVCPYGSPGDRLFARENGWQRPERSPRMLREGADTWEPYYFDADITWQDHEQFKEWGFKRRPSIHMPRRFCRLLLEVTDIRAERLFSITEEDARAEGMLRVPFNVQFPGEETHGWTSDEGQPVSTTAVRAFEDLWHSINGAWADCWVWCIAFRRVEAQKAAA